MSPRNVRIYSENNDFQRAEVLKRNREKRYQYREFLIEGVEILNQALSHRWPLSAFFFARGRKLSNWAKEVLAGSKAEKHFELPPELMKKLSDKEETSELLAIAGMPDDSPARIPVKKQGLVLVFDRPNSPGNLGSSIRSCHAFGADGVIVTGHSADIYHPQAVRGTMGALFAMPVIRLPSHKEVLSWVAAAKKSSVKYQVIGTSAKAEKLVTEIRYHAPTVMVFGNETQGLSYNYKNACDALIRIPISGAISSLNVSCAASICLYEVARQRGLEAVAAPE